MATTGTHISNPPVAADTLTENAQGRAPLSCHAVSPNALFECLDRTVETLSTALVEVRDALAQVQKVSHAYVEGLRAAMLEVAGGDRSSMEGSFRRLDTAVAEYLGRIEAEVRVQNELGHNAVERCDAVLKAAHRIARVAFLARILSLNAAAKSATIHDSAALDVIVQQLTRLSAETGELARRAIDAGNLLVQLLPALAESTSQVSNEVTAFSVSFRDSVQQLGPAAASLQRQLSDDLAKSNKRLRELVAMSRDALSALRFESDFLKTITAAGDTTRELVSLSEVPQRH